jgi:hypothetical protein
MIVSPDCDYRAAKPCAPNGKPPTLKEQAANAEGKELLLRGTCEFMIARV